MALICAVESSSIENRTGARSGAGAGRREASTASAAAVTPNSAQPASDTHRRALGSAARSITVVALELATGPRPASASPSSAAEPNRSAGSLASARCTVAASAGGTVSREAVMGVGFSVMTLATMACAVEPRNGGSPTSIS